MGQSLSFSIYFTRDRYFYKWGDYLMTPFGWYNFLKVRMIQHQHKGKNIDKNVHNPYPTHKFSILIPVKSKNRFHIRSFFLIGSLKLDALEQVQHVPSLSLVCVIFFGKISCVCELNDFGMFLDCDLTGT